jgi:hypothetical protein
MDQFKEVEKESQPYGAIHCLISFENFLYAQHMRPPLVHFRGSRDGLVSLDLR